jgi:hypothetical protein
MLQIHAAHADFRIGVFVIKRDTAASVEENPISLSQILSGIQLSQIPNGISTITRPLNLGQIHSHEVCASISGEIR